MGGGVCSAGGLGSKIRNEREVIFKQKIIEPNVPRDGAAGTQAVTIEGCAGHPVAAVDGPWPGSRVFLWVPEEKP